MSWELKILNEIVLVKSGKRLPKGHSFITEATNHPYIRARDIKNGKIKVESPVFINDDTFNIISRYTVSENDVVITIVGANVGDIAIIDSEYDGANLTENAAKLIPKDNNILSPKFLKYSLFGDIQKSKFQQIAMAAAQPKLGFYKIKDFEINVPNIQTQKRIADILSAYDDLVENNLKRIKLLEAAAQNIYKEWFVNLRFPGYENTPINEETGLPVGWDKITIEEYTKVASRGPSLNYKIDVGFPVLNQSCIRNGEIELDKVRIAEKLKENKQHCYLEINDILINSMGQGTLGRVSKNNSISEKFIIHNCITFLRAKDDYSQTLLYHFISSKEKYFISISQGSTGQTTLKLSLIKELEINAPSTDLMKSFDNQVLPMWIQIGLLKNQNQKLKAARDILLPRLMNRTIEV
jgi:type I restriction enzyme, S subunit